MPFWFNEKIRRNTLFWIVEENCIYICQIILLHTLNLYSVICQLYLKMGKNDDNTKCWRGCGETESLILCWWNVKWYSYSGKQFGVSFKT